ncbi:ABC transporter permease [Lacticaseibacillus yichunensis]|uniref:ABC transporter permease n=1 Tax=Lacticaseibacillus yichunensis TaxID=2486015 RepID=A0ABW4CP55_9LACO|nr:ABC transporter permease [Lacticaseibacillus yichunensis]
MRNLKLIAGQVFRKNIRSFSWWSLVLMPLIGVAVIGVIAFVMSQTQKPATVLVSGPAAVQTALVKQSSDSQHYKAVASKAAGEKQLAAEKADGLLVLASLPTKKAELFQRDDGQNIQTDSLTAALGGLNTAAVAQSLGLTQAQLSELLTAPKLASSSVTFTASGKMTLAKSKSEDLKSMLSLVVGLVMYLFLLSYGTMIAQEIATEKGSRIEESILTAMHPSTQFYGKITGVAGLLGVQLVVYAVMGGVAWAVRDKIPQVRDLLKSFDWSQIGWPFVLVVMGFFIIGILSYTILATVCGSLVANQEQAGQALQPVVMVSMIGYFAAIMAGSGNSPIIAVLSYVPFLSPMIMPARFGVDQVGLANVSVALLLNLVFLVAFTWLAAKAYAANVLVYNDSGLWKAMKKSITVAKAR